MGCEREVIFFMQADLPLTSSCSTKGVSSVQEARYNRAMIRSKQSQIAGLVSAIAAAVLLLLLVVALSIPGFPVAAAIVLGGMFALSIIALTASLLVYIANAKLVAMRIKFLSSELQNYFAESSILGSVRKSLDTKVPVVSGEPEDLLPNRIGIRSMEEARVHNRNIAVDCKKYKQRLEKVGKEFSLVCEGISEVIPTEEDAPIPIEPSDLAGVFLVSFSPDKNPILKITRHAEKMLQSQDGFSNGMIWLCGALSDPKKFASPFLSLVENIQKGILVNKDLTTDEERRLALEVSLISLNIFFSGWCLGNADHNKYLAALVAENYKEVPERNRILDLLGSGNVIAALALASRQSQHPSSAFGIHEVLKENKEKTDQTEKNKIWCSYDDIDPSRCLGALPKQFEANSPDQEELPQEQLTQLLKDLDSKIPSGVLGIIAKASSFDLQSDFAGILDVVQKLTVLFDKYPPLCEQNILLWLRSALAQVGLQKKLRTFLPVSEKRLLEKVLSTFFLGLYVRGLLSVGQVQELAKICNTKDSNEFCQRASDLSLVKTALPALFG